MRLALSLLALALPATAHGTALECTFTIMCSPMTACPDHSGLPVNFDLVDGALVLRTGEGSFQGAPLPHIEEGGQTVLFAVPPNNTVLLTVARNGAAVMTDQVLRSNGVQSVSYFGTCEPAA